MANNLKSTFITNRDVTPKVFTDGFLVGGTGTEVVGSVITGTSDAAGSFYRLVSIPSSARIDSLRYQSAALGNTSAVDIAVWYPTSIQAGGGNFIPTACAGVIISSSAFATNLIVGGPAVVPTDCTNQSGNYLIPLQETPLWNVLGFAADPEIYFDVGFSVRVATGAAGYIGLKCNYQF